VMISKSFKIHGIGNKPSNKYQLIENEKYEEILSDRSLIK